jgi:uncharacterized protein YggE
MTGVPEGSGVFEEPGSRRPDGGVTISVRGESHVDVPPELGTVQVAVRATDRDATKAYERVLRRTSELSEHLTNLHESGVVLRWSVDPLSRWEDIEPTSSRRLHEVRQAVRFTMPSREHIAEWLSTSAEDDGLEINGVGWSLTDETTRRLLREVRAAAVADARARAQDYADAAGLDPPRLTALADTGLLDGGGGAELFSARLRSGSGDDLGQSVRPEDIRVSAEVEARFNAIGSGSPS